MEFRMEVSEIESLPLTDSRETKTGNGKIPADPGFMRLINLLRKVCARYYASGQGVPVDVQWRDDKPFRFGQGDPAFTVVVKDKTGVSAFASLDGLAFVEAYVLGHFDIHGDMDALHSMRDMTTDRHPLSYVWNLAKPLIFGQTRMDRSGISTHYDNSPELYLGLLDSRHRCYSQGVFLRDDESLEDAMTRKIEFAIDAIGAKPGDRVLDIGGGWGAFNEHAGKKGIRVTSLTISKESEAFLNKMIKAENIPCEVINCHLYEFEPGFKFDAIVNLGVTEHLPDYARSLATYQRLLKPGGKVYLDASACREKYKFHSFITKHIYPGNCSPLCLHDYMKHLAKTPFRLLGVWDDRHSYMLTAKHWAQNLERNREAIVRACGEPTYRKFHVYLWGTVDVFRRDIMQAYRWVLELP
jgi:cyclopropane-fatty-acyl-phospholipid synthase